MTVIIIRYFTYFILLIIRYFLVCRKERLTKWCFGTC